MTTMIDSKETVVAPGPETVERRTRGLGLGVVILTNLVLAMGAWIIYDFNQGAATAPTSEMSQLVDDYTTAWNDYDGEAFLALTTPGHRFERAGGCVFNQTEQAVQLESTYPQFAWQVENMGPSIAVGEGPWYVSTPIQATTNVRRRVSRF